jgi:hypothetical protein
MWRGQGQKAGLGCAGLVLVGYVVYVVAQTGIGWLLVILAVAIAAMMMAK